MNPHSCPSGWRGRVLTLTACKEKPCRKKPLPGLPTLGLWEAGREGAKLRSPGPIQVS